MLRFNVHQFHLGSKHYILLPKLNPVQMRILEERLARKGYSVVSSTLLTARSRRGTVHVDPSGLCWSGVDPSDAVLPAIPELLTAQKHKVPLDILWGLYFNAVRSGKNTTLKIKTRIESSSTWDMLRSTGGCALAPDEYAVVSFLFRRAKGKFTLLTDFLADDSIPRTVGKKRYFESSLDPKQAADSLRAVGGRAKRNSYLTREGVVRLRETFSSSRSGLEALFGTLGEWCYFVPS